MERRWLMHFSENLVKASSCETLRDQAAMLSDQGKTYLPFRKRDCTEWQSAYNMCLAGLFPWFPWFRKSIFWVYFFTRSLFPSYFPYLFTACYVYMHASHVRSSLRAFILVCVTYLKKGLAHVELVIEKHCFLHVGANKSCCYWAVTI